ncbi:hypothetical protein D3C74_430250 [compost metagenome]
MAIAAYSFRNIPSLRIRSFSTMAQPRAGSSISGSDSSSWVRYISMWQLSTK